MDKGSRPKLQWWFSRDRHVIGKFVVKDSSQCLHCDFRLRYVRFSRIYYKRENTKGVRNDIVRRPSSEHRSGSAWFGRSVSRSVPRWASPPFVPSIRRWFSSSPSLLATCTAGAPICPTRCTSQRRRPRTPNRNCWDKTFQGFKSYSLWGIVKTKRRIF